MNSPPVKGGKEHLRVKKKDSPKGKGHSPPPAEVKPVIPSSDDEVLVNVPPRRCSGFSKAPPPKRLKSSSSPVKSGKKNVKPSTAKSSSVNLLDLPTQDISDLLYEERLAANSNTDKKVIVNTDTEMKMADDTSTKEKVAVNTSTEEVKRLEEPSDTFVDPNWMNHYWPHFVIGEIVNEANRLQRVNDEELPVIEEAIVQGVAAESLDTGIVIPPMLNPVHDQELVMEEGADAINKALNLLNANTVINTGTAIPTMVNNVNQDEDVISNSEEVIDEKQQPLINVYDAFNSGGGVKEVVKDPVLFELLREQREEAERLERNAADKLRRDQERLAKLNSDASEQAVIIANRYLELGRLEEGDFDLMQYLNARYYSEESLEMVNFAKLIASHLHADKLNEVRVMLDNAEITREQLTELSQCVNSLVDQAKDFHRRQVENFCADTNRYFEDSVISDDIPRNREMIEHFRL